jgi:cytochrome c oxidase subunit 2
MKRQGKSKRRTMMFRSITILALLAMAVVALIPFVANADNPYSHISPRSGAARDIQFLYKVIFWMALVVFIGVQCGIAYTALRYRRRSDDEERPEQIHGNKTLEIAWTIIPAVILIVIFIPSVRTMYDFDAEAQEGEYVVSVYGKQWWWEVHYAKPDSIASVITANEVYVPVGKKIKIDLYSNNVIHSFWVPQLSGKMDVIPGHVNTIGFTADNVGVYYGECAEYCGDAHALMRFKVIVVDEPSFQQWASSITAPPGQQAAAFSGGDVAKAPPEFGVCIGCHRVSGTNANTAPVGLAEDAESESGTEGSAKIAGPNLTNFACRTTIGAGAMPNDQEHLRDWLHDPGAVKPGNYMATQIKEGVLDQPSKSDPNRSNVDILVDYLSALYPDGGCIPITGENADNVHNLYMNNQTQAQAPPSLGAIRAQISPFA